MAEIGRIDRFSDPHKLCSWAGLTPKYRESDTTVKRGGVTTQGSRLVRWAAIEAISRGRDTTVAELYARVKERRGTKRGPGGGGAANFFTSSTTGCATTRSAAWPRRGEPERTQLTARSDTCMISLRRIATVIEPNSCGRIAPCRPDRAMKR